MSDTDFYLLPRVPFPHSVISAALATPPGSPATGDPYIVAASPTGAWTGQATKIARWSGSAWEFQTPSTGRVVYNEATSSQLQWNASAWVTYSVGATGSASGDLALSYPSPTVAAIHETTGPTKLTIGAIADGQVLTRSGTNLIGASLTASTGAPPLWSLPASPHANDDEFASTTLNAAWELYDADSTAVVAPTGLVDPYTGFTTAGLTKIGLHTNWRNSYLALQPSFEGSGHRLTLTKQVTVPTNCYIWARVGLALGFASRANRDGSFGLTFCGLQTTHAAWVSNSVTLYVNNSAGTQTLQTGNIISAGTTFATVGPTISGGVGETYDYMCIHKIGTVYHFWMFAENGEHQYLGTVTNAVTMQAIGFYMVCGQTGAPGNVIFMADFFRQVDTASRVPWGGA